MGFAKALTFAGHNVQFWDIGKKNAFDAFDEFEPEIFVSQSYNLNPAIIECIRRRPNLKVTFKAGDWSNFADNIDSKKYPILKASQSEIQNVEQILKFGNQIFIDIHYPQMYANQTHEYWKEKLGIKVVGLMSGADVFDYTGGKYHPEYASDVIFIGGRWGYKAQTLDPYILPLLDCRENLKVKIFGNQSWNVPQYCGFLPDEHVKHFLASATVCPNVSEPHSQVYGFDIVERPFKLLANKCFVVSDYVKGLGYVIPNGIIYADGPKPFIDACKHYIRFPEHREPIIKIGYETVINNHTYFHRAKQFFDELGMSNEADNMMEAFNRVKEKLCL
jgi:spore maturation protein CgeB